MATASTYEDIGTAIRAQHLATSMEHATCVEPGMSEAEAFELLQQENFDQAPVVSDDGLAGYVIRDDLIRESTGSVRPKIRSLRSHDLATADSPIGETLSWLTTHPILFLLEGNDVTGFITPSDLNKQGGRTYFYLLLAQVELAISELLRHRYADQRQLVADLTAARLEQVLERYEDDQKHDVATDIVSCLTFADLCEIVGRSADLREQFGFQSKKQASSRLEPVKKLRDRVMHPVRALLTDQNDITAMTELDRLLNQLAADAMALATAEGSTSG